jgi:hypothetical protein
MTIHWPPNLRWSRHNLLVIHMLKNNILRSSWCKDTPPRHFFLLVHHAHCIMPIPQNFLSVQETKVQYFPKQWNHNSVFIVPTYRKKK